MKNINHDIIRGINDAFLGQLSVSRDFLDKLNNGEYDEIIRKVIGKEFEEYKDSLENTYWTSCEETSWRVIEKFYYVKKKINDDYICDVISVIEPNKINIEINIECSSKYFDEQITKETFNREKRRALNIIMDIGQV